MTARELQVLQLLAKGMTTVQVAAELCIAPETVRGYRKQLHQKFNVSRVAELIYRAGEMKVI
ncbi:MAG: helix-turn-helix transcriptional regulator [Bacteroidales bacterium]|nr:helix-turn-helix transcriptional regulator [Bacteroidales bacterium]